MTVAAGALNRATLSRQLLLERHPLDVGDAMRRVVALQAQHPASPYIALWNRLDGFDPGSLDAALAGYQVVRAKLMRITIHAVHAEDYRDFREAMDPTLRASRLGDERYRVSGLTAGDADVLMPELLDFTAKPRTGVECDQWLRERLGERSGQAAWWGLKQYAPLWHAPSGGPWSFGIRASYVAAAAQPVLADAGVCAASLRILIRRYLEGFGPASVADVAQFAMVQRARVKAAVQGMPDELEQLTGTDGGLLYDVPGGSRPAEDVPAPPRLLGMWDSVMLAYADRSRVIPPAYRKRVTRLNGDVLPTLLVDGYVAGVWRAVETGIEATAFHHLSAQAWDGLQEQAGLLLPFLAGRDGRAYSRYDHWWTKPLPCAEVRTLRPS
jgi:Winged helix DNA-binding domain